MGKGGIGRQRVPLGGFADLWLPLPPLPSLLTLGLKIKFLIFPLIYTCSASYIYIPRGENPRNTLRGYLLPHPHTFTNVNSRQRTTQHAERQRNSLHNTLKNRLYKRFTAVTAVYGSNGGTTLRQYTADYSSKHARHILLKHSIFLTSRKWLQL